MAKTAGEIFEARDTPSGFLIECEVAAIKSSLQTDDDTVESLPFAFCNGIWTLTLTRRLDNLDIHLNRGVKASSHESTVKFEINIMGNNKEMVANRTVRENWNNLTVPVKHLFVSGRVKGKNAKITCLLQCSVCKFETPEVPATYSGSLGRDLLDLLISGEDSDATIKVKDREFKVHKNIIRVRSPALFAMLRHDVVEKGNGAVDIPDCEAEVFQGFLEYIYTGELSDSSKDIVCSLYSISDKFQVPELKAECIEHMSTHVSLENFCDIATFSVRHNELELLESACWFFADYWKAIVETDQWLSFVSENPLVATDFMKKALVCEAVQKTERKMWSKAVQDGVLIMQIERN